MLNQRPDIFLPNSLANWKLDYELCRKVLVWIGRRSGNSLLIWHLLWLHLVSIVLMSCFLAQSRVWVRSVIELFSAVCGLSRLGCLIEIWILSMICHWLAHQELALILFQLLERVSMGATQSLGNAISSTTIDIAGSAVHPNISAWRLVVLIITSLLM